MFIFRIVNNCYFKLCYTIINFNLLCLQLYRLNTKGQLGVGERCIAGDRQNVKLVVCPLGTVDGPWQYESVCITNTLILFTNK